MPQVIKVKVTIGNDILGEQFYKYRFATKEMEDVGQFEHANNLEEIRDRLRPIIILESWETGERINHLNDLELGEKDASSLQ